MNKETIYIIACQSGGGEKAQKFTKIFYGFNRLSYGFFNKKYSEIIKELSIIFRVDGRLSSWGEKGCNRMRLMKSRNYITIDIGITEEILELSEKSIWEFVWQEFEKATNLMLEKIKSAKIDFDFEKFSEDFLIFKQTHYNNDSNN